MQNPSLNGEELSNNSIFIPNWGIGRPTASHFHRMSTTMRCSLFCFIVVLPTMLLISGLIPSLLAEPEYTSLAAKMVQSMGLIVKMNPNGLTKQQLSSLPPLNRKVIENLYKKDGLQPLKETPAEAMAREYQEKYQSPQQPTMAKIPPSHQEETYPVDNSLPLPALEMQTNVKPPDWSEWSMCNATCGVGVEERSRPCAHTPCVGNMNVEWRRCVGMMCDEKNKESSSQIANGLPEQQLNSLPSFDRKINENLYEQEGLQTLKEEPANAMTGEYLQKNLGPQQPTMAKIPPSHQEETYPVENSLPLPALEMETNVKPSDWSEWNTCNATCGVGVEERSRQCAHTSCVGELNVEWRRCLGMMCDEKKVELSSQIVLVIGVSVAGLLISVVLVAVCILKREWIKEKFSNKSGKPPEVKPRPSSSKEPSYVDISELHTDKVKNGSNYVVTIGGQMSDEDDSDVGNEEAYLIPDADKNVKPPNEEEPDYVKVDE